MRWKAIGCLKSLLCSSSCSNSHVLTAAFGKDNGKQWQKLGEIPEDGFYLGEEARASELYGDWPLWEECTGYNSEVPSERIS